MTSVKSLLGPLLLMSVFSTGAQATSFVMTTDALVSLSMSATKGTSSSFKDDKVNRPGFRRHLFALN
ncbi:hypothetical protein RBU55_18315 [Pseudomonas chlororaphis subsp. aurantiaca]|uniref:hypothetical protein n=1 Tax=Pseudomonas chlororaphis TaxID=587753 RepID=UPI0027DD8B1E|nr:hypothetical protein [Pseudomonas chlororaphis]WMI97526.1 hypothetical protein RBU55_18315 [Pseudomonas chlororaphis subsp. aurantiaca]